MGSLNESVDVVSPLSATKRPPTTLLPAFEPFSSSPSLPKLKRTRDAFQRDKQLPTPIPTSSTHILSSSPSHPSARRLPLGRSASTLSERAPLATVPTIQLKEDGSRVRLGRSSQTCDYQFPSNRLISRTHVEATYAPCLSRLKREKLEIACLGWNGIKIHCQGRVMELKRGQVFSSDMREEEIMLDVHGNRVVLQWPDRPHLGPISSDEEEGGGEEEELDNSPTKKQRSVRRHSTPPSPSPAQTRRRPPVSPISPSPAVQALLPSSPPLITARDMAPPVEIFQDPEPEGEDVQSEVVKKETEQDAQSKSNGTTSTETSHWSTSSCPQEFSDNDEENDPIIHSFGPFGANILPKMAAFNTAESPRPVGPIKSSRSSRTEPLPLKRAPAQSLSQQDMDIRSHVVNQLAYSRLSSTPLSTILSHLPHTIKNLSSSHVKQLIRETDCIGEVAREGKDAAGKPLENEFYYIPERDSDVTRREAVVNGLRKPGLRACRKQHKQYYWKKPK